MKILGHFFIHLLFWACIASSQVQAPRNDRPLKATQKSQLRQESVSSNTSTRGLSGESLSMGTQHSGRAALSANASQTAPLSHKSQKKAARKSERKASRSSAFRIQAPHAQKLHMGYDEQQKQRALHQDERKKENAIVDSRAPQSPRTPKHQNLDVDDNEFVNSWDMARDFVQGNIPLDTHPQLEATQVAPDAGEKRKANNADQDSVRKSRTRFQRFKRSIDNNPRQTGAVLGTGVALGTLGALTGFALDAADDASNAAQESQSTANAAQDSADAAQTTANAAKSGLAAKADAESVYTKKETNTAFANAEEKTNRKFTTVTEGAQLLEKINKLKENKADAANVYSKDVANAKFSTKSFTGQDMTSSDEGYIHSLAGKIKTINQRTGVVEPTSPPADVP